MDRNVFQKTAPFLVYIRLLIRLLLRLSVQLHLPWLCHPLLCSVHPPVAGRKLQEVRRRENPHVKISLSRTSGDLILRGEKNSPPKDFLSSIALRLSLTVRKTLVQLDLMQIMNSSIGFYPFSPTDKEMQQSATFEVIANVMNNELSQELATPGAAVTGTSARRSWRDMLQLYA